MKPEQLRAAIEAMDKRPWYSAESRWQSDCVLAGAPDADMTSDGRVLVQANPNFAYRENLDGIVALANHGDALVELYKAARDYFASDDEDRVSEMDAMVAALSKLERIP